MQILAAEVRQQTNVRQALPAPQRLMARYAHVQLAVVQHRLISPENVRRRGHILHARDAHTVRIFLCSPDCDADLFLARRRDDSFHQALRGVF
jgi:hypothetical protein